MTAITWRREQSIPKQIPILGLFCFQNELPLSTHFAQLSFCWTKKKSELNKMLVFQHTWHISASTGRSWVVWRRQFWEDSAHSGGCESCDCKPAASGQRSRWRVAEDRSRLRNPKPACFINGPSAPCWISQNLSLRTLAKIWALCITVRRIHCCQLVVLSKD